MHVRPWCMACEGPCRCAHVASLRKDRSGRGARGHASHRRRRAVWALHVCMHVYICRPRMCGRLSAMRRVGRLRRVALAWVLVREAVRHSARLLQWRVLLSSCLAGAGGVAVPRGLRRGRGVVEVSRGLVTDAVWLCML